MRQLSCSLSYCSRNWWHTDTCWWVRCVHAAVDFDFLVIFHPSGVDEMHWIRIALSLWHQLRIDWFVICLWKYVERRFVWALRFSTHFENIRLLSQSARRTNIVDDAFHIRCCGLTLDYCEWVCLVGFTLINRIGIPLVWWLCFHKRALILLVIGTVRVGMWGDFSLWLIPIVRSCKAWAKAIKPLIVRIGCVSWRRLV